MLKVFELAEAEDHFEKKVETFIEATNVTNPVQNAVYVTIYSVKRKIELKGDLHVNVVWKFVRPRQLISIGEDSSPIFSQIAELVDGVLELNFRQLDLVDYFFANLRVDWYPDRVALTRDFLFI